MWQVRYFVKAMLDLYSGKRKMARKLLEEWLGHEYRGESEREL